MSRIRLLPEAVVNKIAAGEVVERPASVVKELVENSLDSGANSIRVIIRGSGRRDIRVEDDGCGMERDDLLLAFERHSTSKLRDFPDLEELSTLGFRGEALPSIAGVSDLLITSRTADSPAAARLHIFGGTIKDLTEVGAPVGTVVEVKRLFFNTPARRKFLKSDRTELAHIIARVIDYGLAHPEVAVYYSRDDETILDLPVSLSLRERLADIWGGEIAGSLVPIQESGEGISVSGFIIPPDLSVSVRKGVHLFINRRPVQDRMLYGAVMEGCQPQLPGRRYATGVIFVEISGRSVDVNIHPAKREVRFSHPLLIRNLVVQAVRNAVRKSSSGRTVYSPRSSVSNDKIAEPGSMDGYIAPVQTEVPLSFFRSPRSVAEEGSVHKAGPARAVSGSFRVLGQLARRYVVVESEGGLIIVDQHAAHERIIYERFRGAFRERKIEIQNLLAPINLDLDPLRAALLSEEIPLLKQLGIEIEPFGKNSFIITALPAIFSGWSREELVLEFIDEMGDEGSKPDDPREEIIIRMSCLAAVKARAKLASVELTRLMEDLLACEDPEHCPHGRPTMIVDSWGELEKRFGRR